jgi:hypothetical protein
MFLCLSRGVKYLALCAGMVLTIFLIWLVQLRAFANGAQTWFGPLDWFVRPEVGYGGATDYMALFRSQSSERILSRIAVFKVYAQFVEWAKEDDLQRVFAELKHRHVALAMEAGMLTASEHCGHGVEGYGGDAASKLAARIAQSGGDLAYIVMDEPAFYGHHFTGPNKCQSDLADIAHDAAKNLAGVRAVFPHVRAGDGEPVGASLDDSLIEEYSRWFDAFCVATGVPLAFFQADIQWKEAWQVPLEKLTVALRQRQIPVGVIYNGNDDDTSDQAWIAHAEAHYRAVEIDSRICPDQVVFQSWVSHPRHLLPDTQPGTFTYLLSRYHQMCGTRQ